jgi:hypothetical protein
LGPFCIGGDERQIDRRLHERGEFDLGLLGRFLEALQGHRVLAQVDAFGALEFVGQVVDEDLVEVVAAEVGIAVDAERTSKTPSPTSRTETSNVPPPRSKTQIFSFFFLSRP